MNLPGHVSAEGPERVAHAVGEPPLQLADFQMDDDLGRVIAMDRRRDVGRVGQDRVLNADDRIGEILFARGRESGASE